MNVFVCLYIFCEGSQKGLAVDSLPLHALHSYFFLIGVN